MKNLLKKYKIELILVGVVILIMLYGASKSYSRNNNFEIKGVGSPTPEAIVTPSPTPTPDNKFPLSPITGEPCENATRRTVAVMLAIDSITRPLSGISEADVVFEMPVITDGITRLMAVFGCNISTEIGSIRSARHDFIDLANSVDAIFVHWGGSHFALDKLKTGAIDELDALADQYGVFYRKNNLPAPHNGFTSGERILNAAAKLKYRPENNFKGFSRLDCEKESERSAKCKGAVDGILKIGFPGEFRVEYRYDAATNAYLRWRGGKKEIDRNNKKQVTVKNIIVMYAATKQIEGDYNDVALEGKGKAEFYANGGKIEGIWQKNSSSPKFYYYDNSGTEIKFAAGNIWVEIMQTNQSASWRNGTER